jgi:hypothetical protein
VAPTAAQLLAWQQQLRQRQGTREQLDEVEQLLLNYHELFQVPAPLEAFVLTLPQVNDALGQRLGLYLLDAYRRFGTEADAQRVRQRLLQLYGQDAELAARVRYADILHRLTSTPTLAPADSAALVQMAASNVGFAPVACATLHYFHPALGCDNTPAPLLAARSSVLPTVSTDSRPPVRSAQLLLAPNPANTAVSVTYQLPVGVATGQLLLRDGLGRLVRQVAVSAASRTVTVPVQGLSAGLYACSLLVEGRAVLTRKLAVAP